MNRRVWIRRGAALATVVLAGLAIASTVSAAGDMMVVSKARSEATVAPASKTASATRAWRAPPPALRVGRSEPKIAIGEYLNGYLGELGLNLTVVETATVRPLGNGLRLAEVRIEARGDAAATAAAINWIAVNREVVRLKSLSMSVGPDDEGLCTLVLLMVVA